MGPIPSRSALIAIAVFSSGCFGESSLTIGVPASARRGPPDAIAAPVVAPGKAQLRLLNADEYRNTVRDLLGLEASGSLSHADRAGGYDTGAGGQVGDSLFAELLNEGERLAGAYAATRLTQDFPCFDPANVTTACIEELIGTLGPRAFRRALGPSLREELLTFFTDSAAAVGSRRVGAELLIARLLTSPYFLYRSEVGQPLAGSPKDSSLDPYERASVISYALTGSMPDDLLLKDARASALDEARIRIHVRRLLATAQGKARVVEFFKQWLRVKKLDDMAARPALFPKLASPAQGVALRDEFDAYVASVVFEGPGTLSGVLTESHSFVNKHTAPLYGLTSATDALGRVALNPFQRRGVLTLASTMAAHASVGDESRDRPVMRGLLIKNQLLCEEVGPPSGVNTAMAASNIAQKYPDLDALTVREQYVAMMEQGEACASCHAKFMPLGFAFGSYDGLGRHVTTRKGRPIDTAVNLPVDGQPKSFTSAVTLVAELGALKSTQACFIRNFLSYAAGVGKGPAVDAFALALAPEFEKTQDIKRLLEDTLAAPHLYRRTAEVTP